MARNTQARNANHQSESKLADRVFRQLQAGGWRSDDILTGSLVQSLASTSFSPDMLLLYNLYPLAAIEVKAPGIDAGMRLETSERLADFARTLGLPVAYIADGDQAYMVNLADASLDKPVPLPKPMDLVRIVGADQWAPNDPRSTPPYEDDLRQPVLHQAIAISRVLDHILGGERRALVSMPIGTGITYVALQLVWKLLRSNHSQRVLYLTNSSYDLDYAIKQFKVFGEQLEIWDEDIRPLNDRASIVMATAATFLKGRESRRDSFDAVTFDTVIVRDVQRVEPELLEHFTRATIIGFTVPDKPSSKVQSLFGEPIFGYTVSQAIAADEIKPPEGFRAVKLGEIAEIHVGLSLGPVTSSSNEVGTPIVNGRDLLSDGTIALGRLNHIDSRTVRSKSTGGKILLQPADILITTVGARVSQVQDDIPEETTFSSSLIRIRVDPSLAVPSEVAQFLRSDVGQRAISRVATTSTGVARVTTTILRDLQIFLPLPGTPSEVAPETQLSGPAEAIRQIHEEILPRLQKAEAPNADNLDGYDLADVAERLRRLAAILQPLTLNERVIAYYPMPIALAARRFYEAKFNVYERVSRLKDLFEAVGFFVYNITLADNLRRLDQTHYYVADQGARRAFNTFGMSQRMDFLDAILTKARENNGQDLFLPELIQSSVPSVGQSLQDELRNKMSHTATSTESRLRAVVAEFQPRVEALLEDLDFLRNYQLVRIPSFYSSRGQMYRRVEIYHGTSVQIEDQRVPDGVPPSPADYEHIVLLNNDGFALDLDPLYQLLDSQETRFETHLCFFKQRKQKDRRLDGESVQGTFEVPLRGFDEFESLQARILNTKPGS